MLETVEGRKRERVDKRCDVGITRKILYSPVRRHVLGGYRRIEHHFWFLRTATRCSRYVPGTLSRRILKDWWLGGEKV